MSAKSQNGPVHGKCNLSVTVQESSPGQYHLSLSLNLFAFNFLRGLIHAFHFCLQRDLGCCCHGNFRLPRRGASALPIARGQRYDVLVEPAEIHVPVPLRHPELAGIRSCTGGLHHKSAGHAPCHSKESGSGHAPSRSRDSSAVCGRRDTKLRLPGWKRPERPAVHSGDRHR